jgi:hypothetical protein
VEHHSGKNASVKEPTGVDRLDLVKRIGRIEKDMQGQCMALSDGVMSEYHSIMFGSVEDYLLKFEHHLRSTHGKGSH